MCIVTSVCLLFAQLNHKLLSSSVLARILRGLRPEGYFDDLLRPVRLYIYGSNRLASWSSTSVLRSESFALELYLRRLTSNQSHMKMVSHLRCCEMKLLFSRHVFTLS